MINCTLAFRAASTTPLFAIALLALTGGAQSAEPLPPYTHVDAPNAQNLLNKVVAKHPEVKFVGIHMNLPGSGQNVIIAVTDPVRNGKPSSKGDLDTIESKKVSASRKDKEGGLFEVKSPVYDSNGEVIGMLVEQMPTSAVPDEATAVKDTEHLVNDLKHEIPNSAWMFKGKAK